MEKLVVAFFLLLSTIFCRAQNSGELPPIDKSPMDMSYYPSNYPILKIQDKITDPVIARVIYSRPQKNGRVIFGDLVEYGKLWRLGANEATELEFYKDVNIDGKKVSKGRYTLYGIPFDDHWVIILNKDVDTWGAFKYDDQKDVLRVPVPLQKLADPVDAMAMMFQKSDTGFDLVVAWDNIKVNLPISSKQTK